MRVLMVAESPAAERNKAGAVQSGWGWGGGAAMGKGGWGDLGLQLHKGVFSGWPGRTGRGTGAGTGGRDLLALLPLSGLPGKSNSVLQSLRPRRPSGAKEPVTHSLRAR